MSVSVEPPGVPVVVVVDRIDERAPLLPVTAKEPSIREDVTAEVLEAGPVDESEAHTAPVDKKVSVWKVVWRVTLTLVSIFLLAVFIKGFLDADDVEVSVISNLHIDHAHSFKFDLKKALMSAFGGGISGAAGVFLCFSF